MRQSPESSEAVCNGWAARRAARYLTAAYDKALAPTGLRSTQFTILQTLSRFGPLGIKKLAAIMAMDRTTLAASLKPLDRERFLQSEVDPEDGRARRIEITDEGRKRLEQCLPLWREAQMRFEDAYGAAKARKMRRLLEDVLSTDLDPWAE